MLRTYRPSGLGTFIGFTGGVGSTREMEQDGVTNLFYTAFAPIISFFPYMREQYAILGNITTKPSTVLEGENECYHINYDGIVIPANVLSYPVAGNAPKLFSKYLQKDRAGTRELALNTRPVWTRYVSSRGMNVYITEEWLYGVNNEFRESFLGCFWYSDYYNPRRAYAQFTNVTVSRYYPDLGCQLLAQTTYYYGGGDQSIEAYSIRFDPIRGVQWVPLVLPSSTPVLDTPDKLEKFILSNYSGTRLLPSGSYSWNANGQTLAIDDKSISIPEPSFIKEKLDFGVESMLYNQFPRLGDLSYECIDQMRTFNGNGIALTSDLIGTVSEFKAALKIVKNWRNPRSWASAYLSLKYGAPLTVSDIKALIKGLDELDKKSIKSKVSSSRTWKSGLNDYEYHYGIWYNPFDPRICTAHAVLAQLDLMPDDQSLWDLVPFSFVVDWFVSIGDFLDRGDAEHEYWYYTLFGSISSLKVSRQTAPVSLGIPQLSGSIRLTKYIRETDRTVIEPSCTLDDLKTKSFNHWIEGTALITQKLFH